MIAKLFLNVLQLVALFAPQNNFLRQVHILGKLLQKLTFVFNFLYDTEFSSSHIVPQVLAPLSKISQVICRLDAPKGNKKWRT